MEALLIIERNIREQLEAELKRMGVMYRIFSRVKDEHSISEKLIRKGYEESGKRMTDIIGFRINTYYNDDVDLIFQYFKRKLIFRDDNYDEPAPNVFEPIRKNLTCFMDEKLGQLLDELRITNPNLAFVENTFEIQFRTTLSEGWHEVEHNMRYKCKTDWEGLNYENRIFNGIYAALESLDHTMKSIFEDLAYQHYKNKNWEAMIRNTFRLNFKMKNLDPRISDILSQNDLLAKIIFKIDRLELLRRLIYSELSMPITMDNMIYLSNHLWFRNDSISKITPASLTEDFNFYFPSPIGSSILPKLPYYPISHSPLKDLKK